MSLESTGLAGASGAGGRCRSVRGAPVTTSSDGCCALDESEAKRALRDGKASGRVR